MLGAIRFFLIYFVAFGGLLSASIDSGGGVASLGGGANHSSIGCGFDTSASAAGLIEILYPDIPAGSDADANGLPDAWETQHFGATGASASGDADGDGTSNLMEYLAGTDPRSGTSVFRPSSRVESGKLILTVPTASGRSYRVWGTSNLQGTWTAHDTISGDGSTVAWEYLLSQSPRYFLKIEILIPTN
jgi:hypothetical protein